MIDFEKLERNPVLLREEVLRWLKDEIKFPHKVSDLELLLVA